MVCGDHPLQRQKCGAGTTRAQRELLRRSTCLRQSGVFSGHNPLIRSFGCVRRKRLRTVRPYIAWMCVVPQNNRELVGQPKYVSTGGHLFSICIDKAQEYGFDSVVTGFAASAKPLQHWCDVFGAFSPAGLHSYHFMIENVENNRSSNQVWAGIFADIPPDFYSFL